MSQNFEKLKTLLKELFQLDQPDLDFGLYRVMHAKSAEVSQFLDKDLLPQVQTAFGQYKTADKAELEKELAKVVAGVESAGMDPAQSPKVADLRARLKNDAVDVVGLESEVYDHLFSFFRRYYDQGDFLAKRVYKPGVYAIPYEGEEVTLHWANKDQYYIKTSEYLRDYAFRLRPEEPKRPMRVHFRLADAAEGEHGNVKAAEGKDRVFVLAASGESGRDFVVEEEGEHGKELVLRFEYRPALLTDWPADATEGKSKPPSQKELLVLAVKRVLAVTDAALASWLTELGKPHVVAGGEKADYTRLDAHLRRYTARNTFDYFIHKDLGGFLRRELDFYIKNEVMHLDDVENETAPRVEQYLSKIKVIRKIAGKIIDFLAQLENFQKKLWLKKKFVVETSYCITLGCIPETFYAEIASSNAQREEWVRLFAIDEIVADLTRPGYSEPLSVEFLKVHPTLVLDTKLFDDGFNARLQDAVGDMDAQTDGVIVHSENFQALSGMRSRYSEQVKGLYIDAPYNTGGDGFAYKDSYQHSTWLAMLQDRIALGRSLLQVDAVIVASIDDIEQPVLRLLMDEAIGASNRVANMVWKGATDNNPTRIATEHEYFVWYAKDIAATASEWKGTINQAKDLMIAQWEGLRTSCETVAEIQAKFRTFIKNNRESLSPLTHYDRVDEDGPYTGSRKVHNPGKEGYRYDVVHPTTGRPCVQPARGYRFPPETIKALLASGKVLFGDDETQIIQIKEYLRDYSGSLKGLVELDSRVAANTLESLFASREAFKNPKPVELMASLLSFVLPPGAYVLDCFAGSGTTAHAIVDMNREDAGLRKFILIETGEHFDSVLLPRIKKVTFAPEWKDGKPKRLATPEEAARSPRIVKVVRLESYEDALNNLETQRTDTQQLLLDAADAQGADGLKEHYLLRYMLDVETRGSQSLLNVQAFTDPTAYKLKVKRPGSDESREVNVDLLETFNWLIGLTVRHIAAPQTFSARCERDAEKRLRLKGRLKQDAGGPYWFRTVTGTTPDARKTLIIWRKLTGEPEHDNLVLDDWFTKQGYSAQDSEFDLIYVNGGNNLENLKTPDDRWKVRLIEEDFHRLMFEADGA